MVEEMICEKEPKKLEDMSYEELLEQQKREENFFHAYRDALCDALIEYEGKKSRYIKSIEETTKTLIKIQYLLRLKQPQRRSIMSKHSEAF